MSGYGVESDNQPPRTITPEELQALAGDAWAFGMGDEWPEKAVTALLAAADSIEAPTAQNEDRLRGRLEKEVERRVRAEADLSVKCDEAKSARMERDNAHKRLQDSAPGVAKVLAQVQAQGAAIETARSERDAALSRLARTREVLGELLTPAERVSQVTGPFTLGLLERAIDAARALLLELDDPNG